MKPPAREVAISEPLKALPSHPVLRALFRLKLECDLVQELQSPSFVRTLVKPINCKASQILSSGQELHLELGLDVPPVVSISKGAIAIDTPRSDRQVAKFSDYWERSGKFEAAIGVDINNKLVSVDLSEPESCHVLGAGTTGSGKSVFLQALLLSLFLGRSPSECQLLICDAKRVTFKRFQNCPHLIAPIMSDVADAITYLDLMVDEMESRYLAFEKMGVENIDQYNSHSSKLMPRIVFLFDEFGDLWDSAASKTERDKLENPIIRLGQKARAAGIHLIVFTQRPKKVVTPRLRANCPVRILMTVADADDSESITGNKSVDGSQLIGRGDLFFNGDRLQSLLPDESDFAKLQLTQIDSPVDKPIDTIDKLTEIDELTRVDSPNYPQKLANPDVNESVNLSIVNLSIPLKSILDYAKKQDKFVSASQIKAGVRLFRDTSVAEIRSYFQWLADKGYGVVKGDLENLEFSVN
jgi:DNA segregation ATPase FtsK/SpoIIIE-like protein